MSRPLPARVPEPLLAVLRADPGAPSVDGLTLLLLTIRDDGWPHQAMLSVGEIAVPSPDRVRLAIWPRSTATANLRARPQATLTAVVDGVGYALFLERDAVGELAPPTDAATSGDGGPGAGALTRFDLRVVGVRADEAPYARLIDGVRFALNDREATVARWRRTREELGA